MMKIWEEVHNVDNLRLVRPLVQLIVSQHCPVEKELPLRRRKNSLKSVKIAAAGCGTRFGGDSRKKL
jgi:hypothetical protein